MRLRAATWGDVWFSALRGVFEMEEYDGYYFYSEKQKKIRAGFDPEPTFFANIGGKVVECTERNTTQRPSGPFDDYVYLGRGIYMGSKPR